MTEIGAQWRAPLALADTGVAAVRYLRSHPLLVVAALAVLAVQRRGVAGLVGAVWRLLKSYPYLTVVSAALLSRG